MALLLFFFFWTDYSSQWGWVGFPLFFSWDPFLSNLLYSLSIHWVLICMDLDARDKTAIKKVSLSCISLIKGGNQKTKLCSIRTQMSWEMMGDTCWWSGLCYLVGWRQVCKGNDVYTPPKSQKLETKEKVWSSRVCSQRCNSHLERWLWGRHVQRWDKD